MILELAAVATLARQCGPSVAPETLISLVHAESHFDPYAIGINTKGVTAPRAQDAATAAIAARRLIARGFNIDLGLGQINSSNLRRLGLSVEDAFDPCRNLAASARVLTENYLAVARSSPDSETAIAMAMSIYNTGNASRGFGNGYVDKVYRSSATVVPALTGTPATASTARAPVRPVSVPAEARPATAQNLQVWNTSAGAQTAGLVVFGGQSTATSKGPSE
ncbi:type IV secretion system protein VirB1 [Sphingobium sp. AP50]|uniref:lytic transglycosylase domain-containing protein n=1 Tax=Sphingobium sp. AP50 TaxID=1884369 RepID=UPI0008BB92A0|nr:lytic transglycosylase domain-containing protein [Sphingobium sp. AP50]SEJ81189.1 type IV secretion system protein VirB1 [Sphingobium sp. AP50]